LVPGWNAIYLHIDPSHEKLDLLLQRTPVSQVWLWAPSISTAQFVTNVQDSTDFGSSWISWSALDPNNSNLQYFIGNAAYLVFVDNVYNDGVGDQNVSIAEPYTLSLTGKVVPPAYTWTASGQNFIGFSTKAGSEPFFENFFGLAETLDTSATEVYEYVGGALGSSNPKLVDAPLSNKVLRGRSYWVRDSDYNRFFGTFSLTLQDSAGVHFGTALSAYRIRLSNTANESHTVTLEMVGSELPADGSTLVDVPPVLVRGDLDPTTLTYPFADLSNTPLSWTLAPSGEVGESVEIVLGIDRAAMAGVAGDVYGAILRFTDDFAGSGYTQIDIPATAVTGSMAGLWVGEAEITQVKQELTEFEVDDEGATALNDDGSAVVSSIEDNFGDVVKGFPLRLILHMGEDGTTQLLQRVYYGLDENVLPILATGQNVLNSSHLDVARRITSIHLPWSESNLPWLFDGSLDFISTLSTAVTTKFNDQAANPFLHTYHPDHDNRSPLYVEYGESERGLESFDIIREITLNAGTLLIAADSTTTSTSAETTTADVVIVPSLPDGIHMVDLPEGTFDMGNAGAVGPLADDHVPERFVYMSPFEMSEAEITVKQYVDFLNAAWADGLITIAEEEDGTFVYGATGQSYAGHKFMDLSGSRVLKDHDGDGDIDPENPINQNWIEFDGDDTFSVKDPFNIDWDNFDFETDIGMSARDWTGGLPLGNTIPFVALDGGVDSGEVTFAIDSPKHVLLSGDFAFVSSTVNSRISILDVSNSDNIQIVATIEDEVDGDKIDGVSHLELEGNLLVAVSNQSGEADTVSIYNISDPANPVREVIITDGTQANFLNVPYRSAISDYRLYVTSVEDVVTIFDISTPSSPQLVGEIVSGTTDANGNTFLVGNAKAIEVVDGIAYVGSDQNNRISIIDATDPANPILLSVIVDGSDGFNHVGAVQTIIVSGDNLYFSSSDDDAVTIADISNTSSPSLVAEMVQGDGVFDSLDNPTWMALRTSVLYVPAGDSDAVTIIDVSEPSNPSLVEVLDSSTGFDLLDGAFSVAVGDVGIIVAAEDSNALTLIETFSLRDPRHIVISGDIAYVADQVRDRVSVLDISDPENIEILNELIHGVDGNELDGVTRLSLHDDLLIVLDSGSNPDAVSIYDISANPISPELLAVRYDSGITPNMTIPIDSVISGNYLYISSVEDHLTIFDISDPSIPQLVNDVGSGTTDANGNIFRLSNPSLAIEGDILCVSSSRIQIIDVQDPSNPVILSEIQDGLNGFNRVDSPGEMVLRDGILYFGAGGADDAITIANLSDPSNPAVLSELSSSGGSLPVLDSPARLVLHDELLYVPWTGTGALTIIDVSTPSSPVLLETVVDGQAGYSSLAGATSVAVTGSKVFVTSRSAKSLTVIVPADIGEVLSDWPELTNDLPTQAEVSNWPATFIKWHGAEAFAGYYGCNLPTEAQWEYASKGGLDFDFATADGTIDATKANYNEFGLHPDTGHVEAVKSYSPNPYGLYDMSGNVWEWCRDWYDPDYYSDRPNPDYGPLNDSLVIGTEEPIESSSFVGGPGQSYNGDARVKRGGSWNFHETSLNTAERERDYTWRGNDHFGFRIVKESFSIAVNDAVDFNSLTSSSTTLTGTYQERITLSGKDNEAKEYSVAGEFKLIRISDIDELKTD
jgi:formylglycine-generating enzyme required for sulfatase activity